MRRSFFTFDSTDALGSICEIEARKITIRVKANEALRNARIGRLVTVSTAGAVGHWLIAIIERVGKLSDLQGDDSAQSNEEHTNAHAESGAIHSVQITLLGSIEWIASGKKYTFSRSVSQFPEIDAPCYILKDENLKNFMEILVLENETKKLSLGTYSIDAHTPANIDGDKFFQRHAAILGSTGSGKSWTVASIVEQAAKLPSSNIIVFDLHGEYRELPYAQHLRIPAPDDIGKTDDALLYLPYWMLNAEDLQSLFIDSSEFTAKNQIMVLENSIINKKRELLQSQENNTIIDPSILNSPIPFSMSDVYNELKYLNEEIIQNARGLSHGNFYGHFTGLLTRINSKVYNKRYGFLFNVPNSEHSYESMIYTIHKILGNSQKKSNIKVINCSNVPSEILSLTIALLARTIYEVQFWTNHAERKPLALVCDEAHLYLPKREGKNPIEQRSIEVFEKIAKEGRKYGVSLLIVSQRPSDISTTVLSQCNNIIALRMSNSDDQNTVKKYLPESLTGLLDILPILDIGESVVVGDSILLPSRIRMSAPNAKPLSATVDFWTEWSQETQAANLRESVENMRKQGRSQ